ncbi:MAG: type II toxin-antitoxin system RelE/ParE family toxin [Bacteroidota bacterium]
MNYDVIIQPEAEEEIDEAYEYLNATRNNLGFDFLALLTEIIEKLEANPFQFQKIQSEKRRAVIKRFKYNVIYRVIDDEVFILAVIHGSRDPRRWHDR